jgi:hypothetical protein
LPPKSLETTNIKTTVTLTVENAAGLAWAVDLTGLSLEEIINNLLADELTCFRPDYDDVYVENTLGCWKFKDRASAERTLGWVKERARKGCRGKFPIVETAISEVTGDRFEIDAFKTGRNGKCDRVC